MASRSYADSEKSRSKRLAYWVGASVGLGVAIGALTDDMGVWIALGTAVGLAGPALVDLLSNFRERSSEKH